MQRAFDYIVVGAGSAGCVLANRLSANGLYSVCLLEAGPPDTNFWIHIPIGYGKTMFNKDVNWCFYTDPDPNMLNRRIYWPRGKTLGGSSAINGLITALRLLHWRPSSKQMQCGFVTTQSVPLRAIKDGMIGGAPLTF